MVRRRKKPAAIGAKAKYPGFIEPALASSIKGVPSGERWLHEIKFDGYRVQVHLANNDIRVFTRRGNDWTKRFRKIADDAWHINAGALHRHLRCLAHNQRCGCALRVVAGGKGARHITWLACPRAGQWRHHDAMRQVEGTKPVRLEKQVCVWRLNGTCLRSRGYIVHILPFRE
jgi:hypothetical protein